MGIGGYGRMRIYQAALACRLAILAMVARLQPVAAWIALQLWPVFSMEARAERNQPMQIEDE